MAMAKLEHAGLGGQRLAIGRGRAIDAGYGYYGYVPDVNKRPKVKVDCGAGIDQPISGCHDGRGASNMPLGTFFHAACPCRWRAGVPTDQK